MTATIPAAAASTNGTAKTGGPLHRITVDQHELVGMCMDLETLATEAIEANGYSLQTVLRLPAGPWRDEMQAAHHDTHDRLVRVHNEARYAAGRYDQRPPRALSKPPASQGVNPQPAA